MQTAIESLYKKWEPLVYNTYKSIATKFDVANYREDLLQEGKLGLWKAVNRLDDAKNCEYTYIHSYIKGHMLNYITRMNLEMEEAMLTWDAPINEDSDITLTDAIPAEDIDCSIEEAIDEMLTYVENYVLQNYNKTSQFIRNAINPEELTLLKTILTGLCEGKSYKEIAKNLPLSSTSLQNRMIKLRRIIKSSIYVN